LTVRISAKSDGNMQPANRPVPELEVATAELGRALSAAEGGGYWVRRAILVAVAGLLVTGGLVWRARHRPPPPPRYATQTLGVGDVVERVQATGTVQPLLQVNVGAQANGRVTKVYVDYNSPVKKGDLLAEIDPTFYDAQVAQAAAGVAAQAASAASARANADTARSAYERLRKLYEQNAVSKAELDAAEGQLKVALAQAAAAGAQVGANQAQLSQTKASVSQTRIFAPVDGVVITRSVDVGATVVASLQAPVLFVIAQNLKRMRILADIDEADVGKLQVGMVASAVVDAFPRESFRGTVNQIRYTPTAVQGVVTYSAILEVENPAEKLRPGMTATVSIDAHVARQVVRIPNAALRFRPQGETPTPASSETLAEGLGKVFLVTERGEDHLEPRTIPLGITDGVFTEAQDIPAGARVVVDDLELDGKKGKSF
jgi:HlyD family secretion protein